MPSTSSAQHRLMEAAAHTPGGYGGVPQSVGKEFAAADDAPGSSIDNPLIVYASEAKAAGIMFVTPEGETLLLRRGNGGDYPGVFGLPGGHQEEGEHLAQTARRESLEETGFDYDGSLKLLHDDGHFQTFIARDVPKFDVKICDESTGFVWTTPDAAPNPLHPGLVTSFKIAGARTEFDIAQLMSDGILPSPQFYSNITLLAIRITGTGMAYRSKDQEYVWRDPAIYLNDNFLKRCQALPVIMDHPGDGDGPTMSSKEYTKRNIGSIMLPYIKGDDVWGIARCHVDEAIAKIIADPENTSTSPNVVFNDASGNMLVQVEGEDPLLIEGQPFLIDHIAIVTREQGGRGVWDKGGDANGVLLTNNEVSDMSDPAKEGAKADAQIQPSISDLLAAITGMTTAVTGISSRMDSMEKNMPAPTLRSAADSDEATKEKEDKAKKDAAEKEEKDKKDAEEKEAKDKKDAEDAKKDENLTEKEMEDKAKKDADDEMSMADAQAKADSAYACFGKSASRALSGETLLNYRKRLMRGLQNYSDDCKAINLADVKDVTTLNMLEAKIYADALKHATSPKAYADGQLQAVRSTASDGSGRTITKYYGDINSWLGQFKSSPYRATEFHTANNAKR